MKLLNQFFNFYINSSIHVALAVCALLHVTLKKLGIIGDLELLYFVFFASVTGYNFTKYAPVAKLHHRSLTTSLRWIQVFSLVSFLAMCYFGAQLPQRTIVTIGIFMLCTLGYVVPVFPGARTLRTVPGIKIIIIAICWVGITVIVPVIQHNMELCWEVGIIIVQRLLFIVALMIPFEIRDLNYDKKTLKTVPQMIGIRNSKFLGVLLLFIGAMLDIALQKQHCYEFSSTLLVMLVSSIFIIQTRKNQSQYYCSFWVESLSIVWWGSVLLYHSLFC